MDEISIAKSIIAKNIAENGRFFVLCLFLLNLAMGAYGIAFWTAMIFVGAMVSDALLMRGEFDPRVFWMLYGLAGLIALVTFFRIVW